MFLIFRALVMTLTTQGLFEKCMMYTMVLFHEPSNYANKLYYHSRCWDPIVKYVDEKFQQFLHDETRVNRIGNKSKQFLKCLENYVFLGETPSDARVHALLYFISPTGHGLRYL